MIAKKNIQVALETCSSYTQSKLAETIDILLSAIDLPVIQGSVVLLKPNLVSSSSVCHLGCTSAEFVAAVAKWFLDHGARVRVGDSPAFGSAKMVMRATGMIKALQALDVEMVNFSRARKISLPSGFTVPVAVDALDCDVLINLPKIKAHSQLYVSLAVKNYFGVVCGWKKALHHAVNGDVGNRFESLLVELPGLFPETFTIADGITAMHKAGPVKGEAYPLGLIGVAVDPVALETALMQIIGADMERSIIMQECVRRNLPGTDPAMIRYPLKNPEELAVNDFELPEMLKPVTFHPVKMAVSGCRRIAARLTGG